jgi:hypothetical protein
MSKYTISIDTDALQDIQDATDWYNKQLTGLGSRFQKQVKTQINSLKKNAVIYAVRYENVRCMLIKRFPFMVHFTLNENKELLRYLLYCIPVAIHKSG